MANNTVEAKSVIEIELGQNRVKLEGSESFISDELDNVIQLVQEYQQTIQDSPTAVEARNPGEQATFEELDQPAQPQQENSDAKPAGVEDDPLQQVATSLNLPYDELSRHFYVEGEEIHVQDPRNINPKYALLGYGIIRKHLTGETYLDNRATKEKLIDGEMVDIDRWGSKFLYQLRNNGLIKDDPNSDRGRNKPFKVTPSGFDEFSSWLEGSNGG